MTTIILLLLGVAFLLFAWSAWRWRNDANPASSVEGFARVLEAIDPKHSDPVGVRVGGPADQDVTDVTDGDAGEATGQQG